MVAGRRVNWRNAAVVVVALAILGYGTGWWAAELGLGLWPTFATAVAVGIASGRWAPLLPIREGKPQHAEREQDGQDDA